MSPSPSPLVAALILAAGSSRRFGSDKRQALIADGRRVLQSSCTNACQAFADVRVVLREQDDAVALGLDPQVRVVRSPQADLGMGHSLASGVSALTDAPAEAVAILLADMPWLNPATLVALAALAGPQRIIVPMHEGQQGHPVIIGRHFWPQLQQLRGDRGAKALLAAHSEYCVRVETADRGILLDADTPAALAQVLRDQTC
ncbi:nucleotidyltransferase family protein [Pseudomonas sp. LJDD11]|uniref:nucleotidyltransferase family protein n=1 Tax=Pseudomonas sp. LJDD11 TaxID=2931984 RepID=UPI00211C2370|nr:nucleotidyltransferase family protein [Pseudomonas sp. LJDD11]MCQ9422407.1 nucleotidyltransferase family protein [Pseudomonas sp. LJDD11]